MDALSSPSLSMPSRARAGGFSRVLIACSFGGLLGLGVYHRQALQRADAKIDALAAEKVSLSLAGERAVEERVRAEQKLKVLKADMEARVSMLEGQIAALKVAGYGGAAPAPSAVRKEPAAPRLPKMAEKRPVTDDPLGGLSGRLTGR